MSVADYAFYRDEYFGSVLSEDAFPEYAQQADSYLNELTYGRYVSPYLSERVLYAVKLAECSIADICFSYAQDSAADPVITKETVGSHSVSYRSSADIEKERLSRVKQIAIRYLLTTGLLYRGVRHKFRV